MLVPRKTMETELKTQEKELADDISNLNKKVHPNSFFDLYPQLNRNSSRNT